MKMKKMLVAKIWHSPFEDVPPVTDPPPPIDKTFTQDDVNKFLAADRKKHEEKTSKVIEELNMIRKSKGITDKERQNLDAKITQLEDSILSKEQITAKDKEKNTKRHKEETVQLQQERDHWKELHTQSTINRSITDAAVENEAIVPDQFVSILRPNTQLVEDLNEKGEPTGSLIPQVTFPDVDKDGNTIDVKLSISQAIKRMREINKWQNLFKGEGTGGIGGNNLDNKKKKLDGDNLAKQDVKAYIEKRKAGKIPLQ